MENKIITSRTPWETDYKKVIRKAIVDIDNHISKYPKMKTNLPDIRAYLNNAVNE